MIDGIEVILVDHANDIIDKLLMPLDIIDDKTGQEC